MSSRYRVKLAVGSPLTAWIIKASNVPQSPSRVPFPVKATQERLGISKYRYCQSPEEFMRMGGVERSMVPVTPPFAPIGPKPPVSRICNCKSILPAGSFRYMERPLWRSNKGLGLLAAFAVVNRIRPVPGVVHCQDILSDLTPFGPTAGSSLLFAASELTRDVLPA